MYENLISRRTKEIPVAYLENQVEFMGINLYSQQGVFIPKKQTEFIVAKTIEIIKNDFGENRYLNIVDMCTGIGNIAIAIAMSLPRARIYGVDISKTAIEISKKNAKKHNLHQRILFKTGDLFKPLANIHLEGSIDAIVCNPPYIPTNKIQTLDKSIIEFEPLNAIDGGAFGLQYFMRVVSDSVTFLKPRGFLIFEVGGGQGPSVARLMRKAGWYSEAMIIPCPGFTEEFVLCSLL